MWMVHKLTILRAEKFRIGSSAASDTELSMMNTRMRLVNMWWLMSLWQNTRTLEDKGNIAQQETHIWHEKLPVCVCVQILWYKCFLRVCIAEDKEGTSLWDRNDLLLLHQLRDDWSRPWWYFWILLLYCSIIIVLLLILRVKQQVWYVCQCA